VSDRISRHSHGRSEVWERPTLQRLIRRERRRLGDVLRVARTDRGLTQEKAAEAAGIHPKHLQRIELGSANVTIATLVALTHAYKVSLRDLFASEG
jgi:DNA-binding XRE family transcriptional regulator